MHVPTIWPRVPRASSRNVTAQIHELEDASKQQTFYTQIREDLLPWPSCWLLLCHQLTSRISWPLNNLKSYTPRKAFVCLINYSSLTLSAIKHLLPQLCHQQRGCGFPGLLSGKSLTLAMDPSRGTDENISAQTAAGWVEKRWAPF